MTVDAFRLKNFMAFRDTGWIELRAITLLFGRNSSGKSAIIRALRLLKQSLYNGQDNEVLRFAVEGQLDLGDFQVALHKRPEPNDEVEAIEGHKISFAFRGDLLGNEITLVRQHINHYLATNNRELLTDTEVGPIDFELEFGFSETEQSVQLVGVHIDCPWEKLIQIGKTNFVSASRISQRRDLGREWESPWYWESAFALDEGISQEGFAWGSVQINPTIGFMPRLETSLNPFDQKSPLHPESVYEVLEQLFKSANRRIETFLSEIEYMGPIRPEPRRSYLLDRFEIQHWQQQGLRAWVDMLQHGINRPTTKKESDEADASKRRWQKDLTQPSSTINTDEGNELDTAETVMSQWLSKLRLGKRLIVNSFLPPSMGEISTKIEIEQEDGTLVNLIDVGYGASQILPIFAACLDTTYSPLLIFQQPELHLHPSAQALLGNLFANAVRHGKRIFIETHSEHLLLRLQRIVGETKVYIFSERTNEINDNILVNSQDLYLEQSELSIYFVSQEGFTRVVMPEINDIGEIQDENLPADFEDFFADDLIETSALARISFERMKHESRY